MIIKWKAYEFTTKRSAEVMIPNMGRGMLSHIVVGAAAVFALALYIPHPVLGAWYALLFLSVLGRLYIIKKWSTHSGDHSKKPFRTSHDALAFLAGLLWGSTSFLALYWANWDVQLLMLILSLGMASGSLATLGGMPQTFYLFAIPTILPHVPAFLLSDHSFSAILATLIFLFLVIILTNGKNYSQRLIGYHAQSEDLKKARDVAEKALLKAEVEKQKAERERSVAQKANQAKSDFLASMSHELRTPLNAILGFSQLIDLDTELSNENRDNLHEIDTAGHLLLALIDDLLDLSQIESGKISLNLEEVNIQSILHEWRALAAPLADKYGVEINLGSAQDYSQYQVHTDPTRLTQIILNFVSNAAKYNRPGGTVKLHLSVQPNKKIRFSVSDTGPGISPENQKKLFQSFERLGAQNSKVQGTGIGLVISKKLAAAMDGAIGFESEEGKGSTFWLELECQSCKFNHERPTAALTKAQDSAQSTAHLASAPKTILYIEDNPANMRLVNQVIAQHTSHHLLEAKLGKEGLILAQTKQPDLILLDLDLPDITGYEVLKAIKENESTKDIPVVALSAHAMNRESDKAKEAGFSEYISKPLLLESFLDTLQNKLNS